MLIEPFPTSPHSSSPQHRTAPASVSAQVWPTRFPSVPGSGLEPSPPVVAAATGAPSPTTSTGTPLPLSVPSPSWPWLPGPQHFTPPPVVTAQVWSVPEPIAATPEPSPLTSTGTELDCHGGAPSPSSPKTLLPQHFTPPALVSAQVCTSPAPTAATPEPSPPTSTGVVLPVVVLFPSCPEPLSPQHSTPPELVRAQVCELPALIAANAGSAAGAERAGAEPNASGSAIARGRSSAELRRARRARPSNVPDCIPITFPSKGRAEVRERSLLPQGASGIRGGAETGCPELRAPRAAGRPTDSCSRARTATSRAPARSPSPPGRAAAARRSWRRSRRRPRR